jgi:hypothetical protein
MNYEPGAPPVKCFFFWDFNDCSTYGRIFEVEFALKSRGISDFGSPSGQDGKCEICCEDNVLGLGSVGKIYQARTLTVNSWVSFIFNSFIYFYILLVLLKDPFSSWRFAAKKNKNKIEIFLSNKLL